MYTLREPPRVEGGRRLGLSSSREKHRTSLSRGHNIMYTSPFDARGETQVSCVQATLHKTLPGDNEPKGDPRIPNRGSSRLFSGFACHTPWPAVAVPLKLDPLEHARLRGSTSGRDSATSATNKQICAHAQIPSSPASVIWFCGIGCVGGGHKSLTSHMQLIPYGLGRLSDGRLKGRGGEGRGRDEERDDFISGPRDASLSSPQR